MERKYPKSGTKANGKRKRENAILWKCLTYSTYKCANEWVSDWVGAPEKKDFSQIQQNIVFLYFDFLYLTLKILVDF